MIQLELVIYWFIILFEFYVLYNISFRRREIFIVLKVFYDNYDCNYNHPVKFIFTDAEYKAIEMTENDPFSYSYEKIEIDKEMGLFSGLYKHL